MVEIAVAPPAKSALQAPRGGPPQPKPGQRGDQHRHTDPADDRAPDSGQHQRAMQDVHYLKHTLAAGLPVEHPRRAGIEIERSPLRAAPGRFDRGCDHRFVLPELDPRQPLTSGQACPGCLGISGDRKAGRRCGMMALGIHLFEDRIVPDQGCTGDRDGDDQRGEDQADPFVELEPEIAKLYLGHASAHCRSRLW